MNFFPTLEALRMRYLVDMGTGTYPYVALVRQNPHVGTVYAPFIYKPIRRAHRRLIERALAPFYARVILLDNFDSRWWARGKHISQIYAEQCGCPAPDRGVIYLSEQHRRDAAAYLRRVGLEEFVYIAQVIRHRRPFRSWPLRYYHDLYRSLRDRVRLPVLVDTTGSDEPDLPGFCLRLDRLDVLVAAAVIERARAFIGPDSGLTHVAAALGVPTVSIHLGYPPESCQALGPNVRVVTQQRPFDDPAATVPEHVVHEIVALASASSRPSLPA